MKTRINLYLNEFKPPKELLTVGRIILISAICAALVLCFGIYQRASLAKQQREVQDLTQQKDAAQTELLELQKAYASRPTDELLKREVDELRQMYLSKVALYEIISNLKMNSEVNYSSTMLDVARASSNTMSISRIVMNGKRMDLRGKVVAGDEIPAFVDRFKQLDNLNSRSFGTIKIQRPVEAGENKKAENSDSALLDFELVGFDPSVKVEVDPAFAPAKDQKDNSADQELGREIK